MPSHATSPLRATQPSSTPRTRPASIWAQKGTRGRRARRAGAPDAPADADDGPAEDPEGLGGPDGLDDVDTDTLRFGGGRVR
ncbi:hypothetical protein GCM10028832_06830 [Streptomyces sparsus]